MLMFWLMRAHPLGCSIEKMTISVGKIAESQLRCNVPSVLLATWKEDWHSCH